MVQIKPEATPTIKDDTLLALVASIQSLTLTLQGKSSEIWFI